jgi:hypothetical protein
MKNLNLAQFGKAAFGGAVAFLGTLAAIMVGDVGFGDVTDGQWVLASLEGLVVAGGVYGIPYVPRQRPGG